MKEFVVAAAAGLLVEIVGAVLKTHRSPWLHLTAVGVIVVALLLVVRTDDQKPLQADSVASARVGNPVSPPALPAPTPAPAEAPASVVSGKGSSEAPSAESWSIASGDSQPFLGGEVIISVVGTSLVVDPVRYQVTAVVGGPGRKPLRLDHVDVGEAVIFDRDYDVRVIAVDGVARFTVSRVQKRR